jgi:hypothetical protein
VLLFVDACVGFDDDKDEKLVNVSDVIGVVFEEEDEEDEDEK